MPSPPDLPPPTPPSTVAAEDGPAECRSSRAAAESTARPVRWRRRVRDAAEIALLAIAIGTLGLWCSVPSTAQLATENPRSTAFIDLRRETAADTGKPFKLRWQWRPLDKISRYLRAAVIYAEDYNFYTHDGVDWDAIQKARQSNRDRGELKVGGSTITQQLAKNLFLSPRRSYVRKVREMLIAFSLEDHLSKQRILELYLNVVEWGDGVFGAEAAAHKWFGRSAQSLTPAQAARLAIALPNPITRAPDVQDPELTKKAVRIIRLLRMQGLVDATQEREALDQLGAPDEKVLGDHAQPDLEPGAPPGRGPQDPRPQDHSPSSAGSASSEPPGSEPSHADPPDPAAATAPGSPSVPPPSSAEPLPAGPITHPEETH